MLSYCFNLFTALKLIPLKNFGRKLKKSLSNEVFDSLDFLRKTLGNILAQLSKTQVASITEYDFILEALSVAIVQKFNITELSSY